jgi:hypothetical protein
MSGLSARQKDLACILAGNKGIKTLRLGLRKGIWRA